VLSGKHSPQGIRFRYEGRIADVQLKHRPASTIPGGWTYIAGLDADVGEWVPACDPPARELVSPDFLELAEAEDGFDVENPTITAHRTQYRLVTYRLDDEASPLLPATAKTDDRAQLLQNAWVKLGRPKRAAKKVWERAKADNSDIFRSAASVRAQRRIIAAALKPLKDK
jgi:hypothetical protein